MVKVFGRDLIDADIIFFGLFFAIFVFYLSFLGDFLEGNSWWISLTILYILVFVIRDNDLKKKEYEDNVRIRDRRDIRIDFWG